MSEHAFLSPSAATRWISCRRAPFLEANIDDTGSAAAAEGTAAHELLENVMGGDIKDPWSWLGEEAENGVEINVEMCEHINDVVLALYTEYPTVKWLVEKRVPIYKAIGLDDPLVWGTADLIGSTPGRLIVADLKYGRYAVSPKHNKQLTLYAIGAAHMSGWKHDTIELVVLQPRAGKTLLKTFSYTRAQLIAKMAFFAREIALTIATGETSAPTPGSYCHFCKARPTCPAVATDKLEKTFAALQDIL